MPTETIPSTELVRILIAEYGGPCPVNARKIYALILDGKIPADRGLNGRFEIRRANLPRIAAAIGMAPGKSPALKSSKVAA